MKAKLTNRPLKSDSEVVAVVMAGGSGTRFWPASRRARPKQYLQLGQSGESLIEATCNRLANLSEKIETLIVTSEEQTQLVSEVLPDVAILAEPFARNTAACVGFAAKRVLAEIGDVPMVCLPADHDIEGEAELLQVFREAIEHSSLSDVLVTIGIKPSHPETGFGYLQRGEPFGPENPPAFRVLRFVEKPDSETAKSYLESGDYFWNSGMFVWRPSVILNAIGAFMPGLSDALDSIGECFGEADEYARVKEIYEVIERQSVDFGVMERAPNVLMVPGSSFSWSDVGSWKAWADGFQETDSSGNAGTGDLVFVSCKNSAAMSKDKTIALVGLDEVVVVETEDAILVCAKNSAQDVKKVIEVLEQQGRDDLL